MVQCRVVRKDTTPAMFKTVASFKTDTLKIADDF